jgi:hypothetical protein
MEFVLAWVIFNSHAVEKSIDKGGCTLQSTGLQDICFAQNARVSAIKMKIPP